MVKAILVCLVIVGTFDFASAQANTHVFPQVVDGTLSDGSYYNSFLVVSNLNSRSGSCTLTASPSFPLDRFPNATTFTLTAYNWGVLATLGTKGLASGFLKLQCSVPVSARLVYSLTRADQAPLGMATVFSAPASQYSMFSMLVSGNLRYGLAIANDSGTEIALTASINSSAGNRQSTIRIPARSQYVRFIDEIFSVPANTVTATFELSADVGQFYAVGLLFNGAVFTTLPPFP